jgi:hypothetical protein
VHAGLGDLVPAPCWLSAPEHGVEPAAHAGRSPALADHLSAIVDLADLTGRRERGRKRGKGGHDPSP